MSISRLALSAFGTARRLDGPEVDDYAVVAGQAPRNLAAGVDDAPERHNAHAMLALLSSDPTFPTRW